MITMMCSVLGTIGETMSLTMKERKWHCSMNMMSGEEEEDNVDNEGVYLII